MRPPGPSSWPKTDRAASRDSAPDESLRDQRRVPVLVLVLVLILVLVLVPVLVLKLVPVL